MGTLALVVSSRCGSFLNTSCKKASATEKNTGRQANCHNKARNLGRFRQLQKFCPSTFEAPKLHPNQMTRQPQTLPVCVRASSAEAADARYLQSPL